MEKKDHEFCLRCGRKLKNPEAREVGYGMICKRKLQIDNVKRLFDSEQQLHSSQQKKPP